VEGKLRLVFFGTPEFAVPSLRTLAAQPDFAVVLVVTQPDRPAGRGRGLQPPPVKVLAQELGLPCWQPETLRTAEAEARLAAVAPMLAVVVAYGKIIPASMLSMPRHGFLNVHPSLLPRYRGASPIQAALLNGDAITGISLAVMTPELDAGPILRQFAIPIVPDDTGVTLGARLAEVAAELLLTRSGIGSQAESCRSLRTKEKQRIRVPSPKPMAEWTGRSQQSASSGRSGHCNPGHVRGRQLAVVA
jgi:methionyl-tRNA formyltransferase